MRLEEICCILAHKSAAEYMKMLAGGKVIKKLGGGGFGSVYEVSVSHGTDMDRKSFACKIIRLPRHRRNEAIERAQNEISILRVGTYTRRGERSIVPSTAHVGLNFTCYSGLFCSPNKPICDQ